MEYAKKMILVDPRIIEKLTSARDKVLNSIENEMDTVLNSDIPDDKKAKLYAASAKRHSIINNADKDVEIQFQFNSIQAFIDAAYMHGQRRLTMSSKSKSALILVSVRTINLVEQKSFKFFPETRRVSGCTQL